MFIFHNVPAETCFPKTTEFFPPTLTLLLAWSTLFRVSRTFCNYLDYVKTGCLIVGADVQARERHMSCMWLSWSHMLCKVFESTALKRAKTAIDKSSAFIRRVPLWLQKYEKKIMCKNVLACLWDICCPRCTVARLVDLGAKEQRMHTHSMLFLVTYVFLLRLPSEALPLRAGTGEHRITVEGDCVVVSLPRRKNRNAPCKLVRGCWCKSHPKLCPRHVVGEWAMSHQGGSGLFGGITGSSALACLREMLGVLGVERSHEFRTHDLRRGHAKDLQLSGV